jgi:AcrR family transcriptional regulator
MPAKTRGKRCRTACQQRALDTVEAILEAAAQVFQSRGTTNHIAERAGVSFGTLYQYYLNKAAIECPMLPGNLAIWTIWTLLDVSTPSEQG